MKKVLSVGLALLCCGCTHTPKYQNVGEFKSAIVSWNVIGLPLTEAASILARKGFVCKGVECSRDAGGFPCVQHQWLTLVLDEQGFVRETTIDKVRDGLLPSSCV
jgi:hypothetical protein